MGNQHLSSQDLLTDQQLSAALTGDPELRLPGFSSSVIAVQSRPGVGVTVRYRLNYFSGAEQVTRELVATDIPLDPHPQVTKVSTEAGEISYWWHPNDPILPGLARATDPAWLREILALVDRPDSIQLKVYRPLRRAVVAVTAGQQQWFIKVVRQKLLAELLEKHRLFSDANLGPQLLFHAPEGLLVLAKAPGESLAETMSRAQTGGPDHVPHPDQLVDLVNRLPAGLIHRKKRDSWTERTAFHEEMAKEALPDLVYEIAAVSHRIQTLTQQLPTGPVIATHGDFYEANIFVNQDRLSLIDVDNAGPGHLVDELACLLAHLAVLPQLSAAHYPAGNQTLAYWYYHFTKHVDATALAARTAAVIFSLVGGTTREVALHRFDLTKSWLYRAELACFDRPFEPTAQQ